MEVKATTRQFCQETKKQSYKCPDINIKIILLANRSIIQQDQVHFQNPSRLELAQLLASLAIL